MHDPHFAEELRALGVRAMRDGPGSDAMREYFDVFATTPGELSGMVVGEQSACTCNSATWLTLSTIVTPVSVCCGGTTTTTTSGGLQLAAPSR
jgi:hypothetical protein